MLEFFASVATDLAGGDQAHVFLGSVTVTTDGTGSAQFTETLTVAADSGQRVTATATSPAGDTSIFAGSVKVANPFVVTTTQDDSSQPVLGSLRAAIINANANPGSTPDPIAFQIPTSDPGYDPTANTWTIHLAGELDAITVPVVVDGTTQGPKGYTGKPLIVLAPQAGTSISDGFDLSGNSQGSTIAGLSLSGFKSDGILVSTSQNTIGGTAAGAANVIAGTGAAGIVVDTGTKNQLLSNEITNVALGIVLKNGGNDNQAAPTDLAVTSVATHTTISFTFDATTTNPYFFQFFASDANGTQSPANTFLYQTTITPAATGSATYTVAFSSMTTLVKPQSVTATATSTGTAASPGGDTSEFASSVVPIDAFQVTNTSDVGVGSLRQVILNANFAQTKPQVDITFKIPASGPGFGAGFWTITPASPLPAITTPVLLDGTSQGAALTPLVEISGTQVTGDGLVLGTGSGGSQIQDLALVGFASGAALHIVSNGNLVEQLFLGIDITANMVPGNSLGILLDGAANNTIGGSSAAANEIGSNLVAGISISGSAATGNVISSNYIGTNPAGANLGNSVGLAVTDGTANSIGGTTAGAANTIGFNATAGIQLLGSYAADHMIPDNLVTGNYVGTDAADDKLGNGIGIQVASANNTIGGILSGLGNTIGFNQTAGIQITGSGGSGNLIEGNLIGTNSAAPFLNWGNAIGVQVVGSSSNTIGGTATGAANTIGFNTQNGISILSGSLNFIRANFYLGNNAAETTYSSDILLGPLANHGQLPTGLVAAAVKGTELDLRVSFTTLPDMLDLYLDDPATTQRTYLGSVTVTKDTHMPTEGDATLKSTMVLKVSASSLIVATATNTANGTSAFSMPVNVADFYTVTTSEDHGTGSLSQVITNADAAPASNPQKIGFRIPGAGPFSINLMSALPAITVPVIMDATTEPGYAAMPLILIQGEGIQPGSTPIHGLVLAAGSTKSTIKGLDVSGFTTGAGIEIESNQNTIAADFLGTDLTGTKTGFGNKYGILINGASSNTIGGADSSNLNLVSGNTADGILIKANTISGVVGSSSNVVESSYIGTDFTGKAPSPNGTANTAGSDGILIEGSSSNSIGAPNNTPGKGNATLVLISGNKGNGVEITDSSTGNVIQNAYIGTDLTGSTVLANTSDGVLISGSTNTSVGAPYAKQVNDTTNNTLNVISGNTGNGVEITNSSTGNQVINSYIGVTFTNVIASGKSNGNGKDGVLIAYAQHNVIGGGYVGMTLT